MFLTLLLNWENNIMCIESWTSLQISCKVRTYYNPKGPPGPSSNASEKFFAGVQVYVSRYLYLCLWYCIVYWIMFSYEIYKYVFFEHFSHWQERILLRETETQLFISNLRCHSVVNTWCQVTRNQWLVIIL